MTLHCCCCLDNTGSLLSTSHVIITVFSCVILQAPTNSNKILLNIYILGID